MESDLKKSSQPSLLDLRNKYREIYKVNLPEMCPEHKLIFAVLFIMFYR